MYNSISDHQPRKSVRLSNAPQWWLVYFIQCKLSLTSLSNLKWELIVTLLSLIHCEQSLTLLSFIHCEPSLRARSHQAKAGAKAKRSNNKRQASKKKFAFKFALAWSQHLSHFPLWTKPNNSWNHIVWTEPNASLIRSVWHKQFSSSDLL